MPTGTVFALPIDTGLPSLKHSSPAFPHSWVPRALGWAVPYTTAIKRKPPEWWLNEVLMEIVWRTLGYRHDVPCRLLIGRYPVLRPESANNAASQVTVGGD